MVLSETIGTNITYYWQGLDVLAQSDGTTTQYFEYDGLGSVRQLTDTSGVVGLAQTFDPYGNLYSRSGVNSTKYAFTGEQQDTNGLLFLRARYYASGMGRFFQTDPSRGEQNPYQYGMSNPILNTDPSGLCANCASSGAGSSSASLSFDLTITLSPELLAMIPCSLAANSDLQDFMEGMRDQVVLDLWRPAAFFAYVAGRLQSR